MTTSLNNKNYIQAGGSFGSSQMWFEPGRGRLYDTLRAGGCGVVAAADAVAYLEANGTLPGGGGGYVFDRPQRIQSVIDAHRTLARVRRFFGASGLALARGLRRLFKRRAVPLDARWYCPADSERLFDAIEDMLSRDCPAVFSLPPRPYAYAQLWLYASPFDARTRAHGVEFKGRFGHYVVATALDRRRRTVEISSWGKRYYVSLDEYARMRRTLFGKITGGTVYIRSRQ